MTTFPHNKKIKGVIKILPPAPHSVWHGDVSVIVEEYVSHRDPSNGLLCSSKEVAIAAPAYIEFKFHD